MNASEGLAIAVVGGILAGLTGCGGSPTAAEAPAGSDAPMNMAAPSSSAEAGEKHECSADHKCNGKMGGKKEGEKTDDGKGGAPAK